MSQILKIADAVASHLNAGTFSQPIDAQRRLVPSFELPDLQSLQVSVVPRSVAITGATRHASYFDYSIDVGVQKKLADDPVEVDGLLDLVEELADWLRSKRLSDAPDAAWVSIQNEPVCAPEHLDQMRTFTSILTVTYRLMR